MRAKDEDEYEKALRLARLMEQLGSEPDGNPEDDVLRALIAHPAAIKPLYGLLTGEFHPAAGRMPMLSEIGRIVKKGVKKPPV